jgi:hypothetical protein
MENDFLTMSLRMAGDIASEVTFPDFADSPDTVFTPPSPITVVGVMWSTWIYLLTFTCFLHISWEILSIGTRLLYPTPLSCSWGRPAPTLVPWRQRFRLQQGTSVGVGLPKPSPVTRRFRKNIG